MIENDILASRVLKLQYSREITGLNEQLHLYGIVAIFCLNDFSMHVHGDRKVKPPSFYIASSNCGELLFLFLYCRGYESYYVAYRTYRISSTKANAICLLWRPILQSLVFCLRTMIGKL